MDKPTATRYDALLLLLSKNKNSWHVSHILIDAFKLGFLYDEQVQEAIGIFHEDGFIEFIKHPNAPEHNFGIYNITSKGVKFIRFEGGYTEKRLYENYNKTNVKFTWIRHWLWFYTAIVSLLANLFFICKYLFLLL